MPRRPFAPDLSDLMSELFSRVRALEDNRRYPDRPSFYPDDCIKFSGRGYPDDPYRIGLLVDPDTSNQLECTPDGLFLGSSPGTFDAIVDNSLLVSDPDNRLFLGIGEALDYLRATVGLTKRAFVLVRHHATGASGSNKYVETASVTAPDNVTLISTTAWIPGTTAADAPYWDHAGFTPVALSWNIHGLQIGGKSSAGVGAKTSLFGSAACHLVDCYLEPNNITASSGRYLISTGWTRLDRCKMENGWMAFTEAYDCDFRIFTSGTYNPSNGLGRFVMMNCGVCTGTSGSGATTWSLPIVSELSLIPSPITGSADFTLSCPSSVTPFSISLDGVPANVSSSSGAEVIVRGTPGNLTLAAPSAGNTHDVRGTQAGAVDITGPALVDIACSGIFTARTGRVVGKVITSRTSSGANLRFIDADYCNIHASALAPGGSPIPYSFDATSDNNILVFAGTSQFSGGAGTDAGTGNYVTET